MTVPNQPMRLSDLFYIIFRAWRKLIVFALIGTLLLGGFGFYRSRNTASSNEVSTAGITLTDKEVLAIKDALVASDREAMNLSAELTSLNSQIAELNRYLANSIYLKIDWSAPPLSAYQISITPEAPSEFSEDSAEQRRYIIGAEIIRQAKSENFYFYLADNTDASLAREWIYELIYAHLDDNGDVYIEIVAPNDLSLNQLLDASQQYFRNNIREFIDVPYLYSIDILSVKPQITIDEQLRHRRGTLEAKLVSLITDMSSKREILNGIVDEAVEQEILDRASAQGQSMSVSRSVKQFAIIGFMLGALATIFFVVTAAGKRGVILDPQEYAAHTDLFFLGSIASLEQGGRKKIGAPIDRLIDKLFYGRTEIKEYAHHAAMVSNLAQGIESIAFVSEKPRASLATLMLALNEERGTISSDTQESFAVSVNLENDEDVKQLRHANAAFVVIETRRTTQRQAAQIIELLTGMNIKILGLLAEERLHES